jgi:chemotaxis protein MotB
MARKKAHGVEHPDERWLLTYADMITLLMALFMVLYAMSMVNKTKFEALRLTLKQSFSSAILTGGTSILDHGAVASSQTQQQSDITGKDSAVPDAFAPAPISPETRTANLQATSAAAARAAELKQDSQLEAAKAKVNEAIRKAHLQHSATAFIDPRRGLVIRLVTDDVLFGLGSYVLRPSADPLLTHIAAAIQPLPNEIHVEGYTDTLPCSCSFGNVGLSFERAQTVLQYMAGKGFTIGDRHDAVAVPYGSRFPLAPNSSTTGNPRNRRVEIVVLRNSFSDGTSPTGPLGNAIGTGPISAQSASTSTTGTPTP